MHAKNVIFSPRFSSAIYCAHHAHTVFGGKTRIRIDEFIPVDVEHFCLPVLKPREILFSILYIRIVFGLFRHYYHHLRCSHIRRWSETSLISVPRCKFLISIRVCSKRSVEYSFRLDVKIICLLKYMII